MSKTATLKIYGDIGEPDVMAELFGITDNTTSALMVSEFLDEHPDATTIVVRINSRGGDVQEGWAILDLLLNSGKKIKTIGEGKIYSIATIIFLAGTEREIMKNADGLIHNPFIPPYTLADAYESSDLLKIAESLVQEEDKILNFYAERTGSDKAKLAEYMKDEIKLSAEDMLSLGFATKIVEPVKAYAYFNPQNIIKMDAKAEEKFMDKVTATVNKAIAALGLSRLPNTAQDITDKDGKVLKLDKESGEPAVGDSASPDGTYTMESGSKITVADGKITAIETEEEEEDELLKAQAEVERLTAELAEATTAKEAAEAVAADAVQKVAEAEAAKAEAEALKVQAQALVTELEGLKNEWKPEARGTGGSRFANNETGIDTEKVQEIRNKMKK